MPGPAGFIKRCGVIRAGRGDSSQITWLHRGSSTPLAPARVDLNDKLQEDGSTTARRRGSKHCVWMGLISCSCVLLETLQITASALLLRNWLLVRVLLRLNNYANARQKPVTLNLVLPLSEHSIWQGHKVPGQKLRHWNWSRKRRPSDGVIGVPVDGWPAGFSPAASCISS